MAVGHTVKNAALRLAIFRVRLYTLRDEQVHRALFLGALPLFDRLLRRRSIGIGVSHTGPSRRRGVVHQPMIRFNNAIFKSTGGPILFPTPVQQGGFGFTQFSQTYKDCGIKVRTTSRKVIDPHVLSTLVDTQQSGGVVHTAPGSVWCSVCTAMPTSDPDLSQSDGTIPTLS